MRFRTEVEVKPFAEKIDHNSKIFSVGSCFADNMAGALSDVKFKVTSNPTGVLFNPASIHDSLIRLAENKLLTNNDLHTTGDMWFSYDFHSSFNGTEPIGVLKNMNQSIECGHNALMDSDWVIITFGTAWVYHLNTSGKIVANCHKQPASNFTRRRLSIEDIVDMYDGLMRGVLADKQIIFTVSPVRHLGDGADENFLSKSILKVAIAEIVERFDNAHYFPAYEILNDDLRDYRFYGEDMCHPSTLAVEYIRDKFFETILSEQAMKILPQILKICKSRNHNPLNKDSESYLNFCQMQLDKIAQLSEVDFEQERLHFEREIELWHTNSKK
jgi:hypothetical protein